MSKEGYYQKLEREAGEELESLLSKPIAPTSDLIGVIDEITDKSKYFDPWDIFPIYGSYSSAFDCMALGVLENLASSSFEEEELAHEIFREMLCNKNLCDYGTSPRLCFPTPELRELLPKLIRMWKEYYELIWGEKYDE